MLGHRGSQRADLAGACAWLPSPPSTGLPSFSPGWQLRWTDRPPGPHRPSASNRSFPLGVTARDTFRRVEFARSTRRNMSRCEARTMTVLRQCEIQLTRTRIQLIGLGTLRAGRGGDLHLIRELHLIAIAFLAENVVPCASKLAPASPY